MKDRMTNEEFVVELMNYSPYGALCQPFILQAIEFYCDEVNERKEEELKKEEEFIKSGKMPLISAKAWVGIAEDIKKKFEERRF